MSDQQDTTGAQSPEQGAALTSIEGGKPVVKFDADKRAADRARNGYLIEGTVYTQKKKTGRLVKQIIEMAPTEDVDEDDREGQLKGVDLLYQQVALLLVDSTGTSPDPERLMDELDLEDARDMIGLLMGNAPEDEAGNASSPAS